MNRVVDEKLLESRPDGILATCVAALFGTVPLALILWFCRELFFDGFAKNGNLRAALVRSGAVLFVLLALSRPYVLDVVVGFLWDTAVVQPRKWWRNRAGVTLKLLGVLIYGTAIVVVGWYGWAFLDSARVGRIERKFAFKNLAGRVDLVEAINDVVADTEQHSLPKAERSVMDVYSTEERLLSSVEQRYKRLNRAILGSRHEYAYGNLADNYLAFCLEELPTSDERVKELRNELDALKREELPEIAGLLERLAAAEDATEHTAEHEMLLHRAKVVVGWVKPNRNRRRRRPRR